MKKYEITSYEVENEEITGTKQLETRIPEVIVEAVRNALNGAGSENLVLGPMMIIPEGLHILFTMLEKDDERKIIGKYNVLISKCNES